MRHFYKLTTAVLLTAISVCSYAQDPGSPISGIVDNGLTPIIQTPEGDSLIDMTRSGSFVGYDEYEWTRYIGQDSDMVSAVVLGKDGSIYVKDPVSRWKSGTWMKIEKDGDDYVARFPQVLYTEGGENYYMFPLFAQDDDEGTYAPKELDDNNYVSEVRFTYKNGVLRQEGDAFISLVMGDYTWMDSGDGNIVIEPMEDEPNTVSNALKAKAAKYILGYNKAGANVTDIVNVITDGNKVYLNDPQIMNDNMWIEGTINGDKAEFTSGQYLGVDSAEISHYSYFKGQSYTATTEEDEDGDTITRYNYVDLPSITLAFNAADSSFTATNGQGFTITKGSSGSHLNDVKFYLYKEVAAKPKTPYFTYVTPYDDEYGYGIFEFVLPTEDVNGKFIDPNKLYYCFYLDDDPNPVTFQTDEDNNQYTNLPQGDTITYIPFYFNNQWDLGLYGSNTHQMYYYFADYDRVGVQSIYTGGNAWTPSEIAWYVNPSSGIDGITDGSKPKSTKFFDLSGRIVPANTKGLIIKRETFDDGTVKVKKVIK